MNDVFFIVASVLVGVCLGAVLRDKQHGGKPSDTRETRDYANRCTEQLHEGDRVWVAHKQLEDYLEDTETLVTLYQTWHRNVLEIEDTLNEESRMLQGRGNMIIDRIRQYEERVERIKGRLLANEAEQAAIEEKPDGEV